MRQSGSADDAGAHIGARLMRWSLPVAACVSLFLLLTATPFAAAQQFWFAAQDTVTGRAAGRPDPLAYMDLFAADAPWPKAEAGLSVFKVPMQFLLQARDDQVTTVFHAMASRHIKMAVEMGAVEQEESCGGGEGYMQARLVERAGQRLAALGLQLDLMAMDEPVWMAHERSWGRVHGKPDCQYPLPKLVQQVALTVTHMRVFFPKLVVGDIEVVGNPVEHHIDYRKVMADYTEFARLFAQATGTRLAFFHCDIRFQDDWKPVIEPLARAMHDHGIRFGAIIGGTPQATTDEDFVQMGLAELTFLEKSRATRLDDVIIHSWQPRPTKFLPETDPGTSAYLLLESEKLVAQVK